jgi:hypothetical protein
MTITVDGTNGITYPQGAAQIVGAGPAFYSYLLADQSITTNTVTKITLNTELFDTNSNFDPTTNYRFTPTVAGYYQINAGFLASGTALTLSTIYVRKNGSTYAFGQSYPNTTYTSTVNISTLISFNGSTDYVELFGLIIGTSPIFGAGAANTFMNGCLIRGA